MSKLSKLLTVIALMAITLAACGTAATPTPVMTEPPATEAPTMPAATEAATATEAPVMSTIDCMGAASGDEISMIYQWSGVEEESFNQILQPLVDACGIVLKPESTRDQALLDTRVTGRHPAGYRFLERDPAQPVQGQALRHGHPRRQPGFLHPRRH